MIGDHSWRRRSSVAAIIVVVAVTLAGFVLPERGARAASPLHCNHGRCPEVGGPKTCIWGPYMQCHFLAEDICDTAPCDTALEP